MYTGIDYICAYIVKFKICLLTKKTIKPTFDDSEKSANIKTNLNKQSS